MDNTPGVDIAEIKQAATERGWTVGPTSSERYSYTVRDADTYAIGCGRTEEDPLRDAFSRTSLAYSPAEEPLTPGHEVGCKCWECGQAWCRANYEKDPPTVGIDSNEPRIPILAEILAERVRQDAKWGGPEHDDQHFPSDWINFIHDRCNKAADATMNGLIAESHGRSTEAFDQYRNYMVQIAALAVAAIESYDRKQGG